MAEVVIFGVKDFASLAHFYLRHDSEHRVVAFTVHREFMPAEREFEGLPVVPLEELEQSYPPDRVSAFAPMSHRKMNRLREGIYNELKGRGYRLISYVSSRATTFPEGRIGDNCFILEDNTIQPFVTIGNNVTLWSGNHIGHDSTIADHCFISSHVVVSGHVRVRSYCFIGVNATLRNSIEIAEGTLIGAGAVVMKNTIAKGVYLPQRAQLFARNSDEIDP